MMHGTLRPIDFRAERLATLIELPLANRHHHIPETPVNRLDIGRDLFEANGTLGKVDQVRRIVFAMTGERCRRRPACWYTCNSLAPP